MDGEFGIPKDLKQTRSYVYALCARYEGNYALYKAEL